MSARLEELSPLLALPLDCQAPGGGFHGCSKPQFPHLLSENKQSCGIDRLSHPWADWTQEGNPWRENRVSVTASKFPPCCYLPSHLTGLLSQFLFQDSCILPWLESCRAL